MDSKKIQVPHIPTEVLSEILKNTNITDSMNTLRIFNIENQDKISLLQKRVNPEYIFKDLTEDIDSLMEVMINTNSILTGSRALEYFRPNSCNENSDYDIITRMEHDIPGVFRLNTTDRILYIEHHPLVLFLENIGFKYKLREECIDFYDSLSFYILSGQIINKKGKTIPVSVSFVKQDHLFDHIALFSHTATQCFIHPYVAVHMYGDITLQDKMYVWKETNEITEKNLRNKLQTFCYECSKKEIEESDYIASGIVVSVKDNTYSSFCIAHSLDPNLTPADQLDLLIATDDLNIDSVAKFKSHLKTGHTCKYDDPINKSIIKYINRGFSIIETESSNIKLQRNHQVVESLDSTNLQKTLEQNILELKTKNQWKMNVNIRKFSDNSSLVIPFSKYLDYDDWDVRVKVFLYRIDNYRWMQNYSLCLPLNSLTDRIYDHPYMDISLNF